MIATMVMFASLAGAIGLGLVVWRRQGMIKALEGRQAAAAGMSLPVAPDRWIALRERSTTSQGDLAVPAGPTRLAGIITAFIIVILLGGFAGYWFVMRDQSGTSITAGAGGTVAKGPLGPDPAAQVPSDPPAISDHAAYTVAVLNASGVTGAAATTVAPKVETAGYRVGDVADVSDVASQNQLTSVVMWKPGQQAVAQNVARDLGITQAPPLDGIATSKIGIADVVVVVGKDLAAGP